MKGNSNPLLAQGCELLRFTQDFAPFRDEDALPIVGVDRGSHQTVDWPAEVAVDAIEQNGLNDSPRENAIALAGGLVIVIHLRWQAGGLVCAFIWCPVGS